MKIWRSVLFSMGILVVVSFSASAQSNTVLDKILAAHQASFADVAYLVMSATKKVPDSASPAEAASAVGQQGWKITATGTDQPVTLGTYCYLIMKAFGMKGGLWYMMFPGPRYAERQLDYLGFIHGYASPYRTLSGREAVDILGSVLNYEGAKR